MNTKQKKSKEKQPLSYYLQKMTKEKVVPKIAEASYIEISKLKVLIVGRLRKLLTKIKKTDNPEKRKVHLAGFMLGLGIIKALADELNNAYIELKEDFDNSGVSIE